MTLQEILSRPPNAEEQAICTKVLQVPGAFNRHDIVALYRLVKQTPNDALLLEMGSYRGRSTNVIGHAMIGTERRLVCIDSWTDFTLEGVYPTHFDFFREFHENTESFASRIMVLRGDIATQASFVPSGLFGLAFLDADKTYEGMKTSIAITRRLLNVEGILCGHDYSPNWDSTVGLVRAVDEEVPHVGLLAPGSSMWYTRLSERE